MTCFKNFLSLFDFSKKKNEKTFFFDMENNISHLCPEANLRTFFINLTG